MNGRTRQGGDSKVGSADGTGVPLRFTVTGRGGVPAAGVDAVSLNVTVDQGELPDVGGDYVTVDGCATPRPTASNLNFGQDQTVPNAVITPVSPVGARYSVVGAEQARCAAILERRVSHLVPLLGGAGPVGAGNPVVAF